MAFWTPVYMHINYFETICFVLHPFPWICMYKKCLCTCISTRSWKLEVDHSCCWFHPRSTFSSLNLSMSVVQPNNCAGEYIRGRYGTRHMFILRKGYRKIWKIVNKHQVHRSVGWVQGRSVITCTVKVL